MEGLLDRIGIRPYMKFVLGEIRRDTRLVFGGPCKDVLILMEEIDELVFLFAVKTSAHDNKSLQVVWVQGDPLGLFGLLE